MKTLLRLLVIINCLMVFSGCSTFFPGNPMLDEFDRKFIQEPVRKMLSTNHQSRPMVVQPPPKLYIESTPASAPTPTPRQHDFYLSRKKAEFLVNELERMVRILSSPDFDLQLEGHLSELLDPDILTSWFDLERPEPQGIYYWVLGIPINHRRTLLFRTKSEFYMISEDERLKLKGQLEIILRNLRSKIVSSQSSANYIGFDYSDLP